MRVFHGQPLFGEGLDQGVNVACFPHRDAGGDFDSGREFAFLTASPPGAAGDRQALENLRDAEEGFSTGLHGFFFRWGYKKNQNPLHTMFSFLKHLW